MRTTLTVAGLLCVSASLAAAQSTPGPRRIEAPESAGRQAQLTQAHSGFQRFLARTRQAWTGHFDENSGLPTLVVGEGIPLGAPILTEAAARAAAETARLQIGYLWGSTAQFAEPRVLRSGSLYIVDWRQTFDGLDVVGGRLQLQIHASGRVAAIAPTVVPFPDGFARDVKITAEAAQAAVKAGKTLLASDRVETEDLVIHPRAAGGGVNPTTAFVVKVTQPSRKIHERVYVDAATGAILEVVSLVHELDVKGKITANANAGLSGLDAPTLVPLGGIQVNVSTGGLFGVTDAAGDYTIVTGGTTSGQVSAALSGPHFVVNNANGANQAVNTGGSMQLSGVTTVNFTFNQLPDEFTTAETTAAHHMSKVFDYIAAELPGFQGFPSQGVYVNITDTCNAYYESGNNTVNFFKSGAGCPNTAYSTVVYHEYGHGVDDYYFGIQSGSLSEGIGDICAMFLTGQPVVGQDFHGQGTMIRTGENTKVWPASSCGGEVHCVGETFMGFAWQLYKALQQTLGSAPGADYAQQIVLGTFPAGNSNIPDAVTQVFLQDDNDGNIANGSPNFVTIATIAQSKGFTPPQLKLLTVAHANYPDTASQTQPYPIYATITAQAPSVYGSAFVDYNVNGGPLQLVAMHPTASPNVYAGYIPPQIAPAVVNYWIRALDQLGSAQTFPSGDNANRFAVGKKTVLLNDKMENGVNGWTHGQLSSADDWVQGAPQFAGVNPYDPLTAYSGTKCWGNDLNLTALDDGLYDYGMECFLDTPALNATGKTGMHVRFRRWLTVERGVNDKATMLVNNTTIYANPTNADLLETAWSLQDYSIPTADNQASFKVRWKLKSDLGIEYGGWNVDDVQVYSLQTAPVLNLNITGDSNVFLAPFTTTLTVLKMAGTPNGTFELYASLDAGTVSLDGIGVVEVGPATLSYFLTAQLDAAGKFDLPIPIPYSPLLQGLNIYWAGAVATATSQIQVSNVFKMSIQ